MEKSRRRKIRILIVILISAKHLFRRIINKKRDSGLVFKFVKEELTAQSADSNIPSGY